MERQVELEVMTPERLLVRELVDEVIAPGTDGEFGVRAGHCPFITTLRIGELRYLQGGQWKQLVIIWGYAHVEPKRVTVLARMAEHPEEIDISQADADKRNAREVISSSASEEEKAVARVTLQKAMVRIRVRQDRNTP